MGEGGLISPVALPSSLRTEFAMGSQSAEPPFRQSFSSHVCRSSFKYIKSSLWDEIFFAKSSLVDGVFFHLSAAAFF